MQNCYTHAKRFYSIVSCTQSLNIYWNLYDKQNFTALKSSKSWNVNINVFLYLQFYNRKKYYSKLHLPSDEH